MGLLLPAVAAAQASWRRGSPPVTLGGWSLKQLTLHVRLSAPARLEIPEPSVQIVPSEGGLAVQFWTDANAAPLKLSVPVAGFQTAGSHDLVLRYRAPKLDLYFDGVLVDEEWPHGNNIATAGAELRTDSAVESVAIWQKALEDPEVLRLCAANNSNRELDILGPERPVTQFWKPRGHNTSAGDAMPFFHDGRFHVYYLFDRRHHGSKWGLGAHQWAHMSTPNLRDWEQHPLALSITEEWEASICTGSVFHDKDTWYAFYATRMPDRSERLGMATGADGIHFTKVLPTPFAEPQPPYRRGPNRDPFVFRHPNGGYRMLATSELVAPPAARRGGALELLTSPDARRWTAQPPFYVPGYVGSQPECSDLFEWNGWFYLLFGQDGATHYRMSRGIDGPWLSPGQDILDSPQSRVMKTAAFTMNRRLGVSFIPVGGWGGNLVFREIVQRADGTLGTRTPKEMVPNGQPVSGMDTSARIDTKGEFRAANMGAIPKDALIRMCLAAEPGTLSFGITVRGSGACEQGLDLCLDPVRRRAEWRPVETRSLEEKRQNSIEAVDGLDGPIELEVLMRGDIMDACINGNRTLIHRAPAMNGDRLFVWAHSGALRADRISVTHESV